MDIFFEKHLFFLFFSLCLTCMMQSMSATSSGFISPMKCFEEDKGIVYCLVTKLDTTKETENGLKALIPDDTEELTIFCSSRETSQVSHEAFLHLSKLRLLKFWSCQFPNNPFEDIEMPPSVRSIALQDTMSPKDLWFLPTRCLCWLPEVTNFAMTHQNWPYIDNLPRISNLLDCSKTGCCKTLLSINVSFDSIRDLKSDTFQGLDDLNVLDLEGNSLNYLPFTIFSPLKSIKRIILTGNPLVSLDLNRFYNNPVLSDLVLDYESETMFAPALIKVFSRVWNIQYNSYCTRIDTIDLKKYLFLQNIKSFSLCIPLEYNDFGDFLNLYLVLHGMTNLTQLSLQIPAHRFESNMFSDLTALRYLTLRNCKLKFRDLHSSVFSGLEQLESLKITTNYFYIDNTTAINGTIFKDLQQLKRVYLPYNDINLLPDNCFDNLYQLQIVDLSHNVLNTVPRCLCNRESSAQLRELNLAHNSLTIVGEDDLMNCNELQTVDMNSNALTFMGNCSLGPFRLLTQLNHLNLANNKLRHFDICMIPQSLEYLDLTRNDIAVFEDVQNLRGKINLQIILLWENNLKYFEFNVLPHTVKQFALSQSLKFDDIEIQLGKSTFENLTQLEIFVVQATRFNLLNIDRELLSYFSSDNGTYFEFSFFYTQNCPFATPSNRKLDYHDFINQVVYNTEIEQSPYYKIVPYYNVKSSTQTYCMYKQECISCWNRYNDNFDFTTCRVMKDNHWLSQILFCGKAMLQQIPSNFPQGMFTELYLDGNNLPILMESNFSNELAPSMELLRKIFLNSSHVSVVKSGTFQHQNLLRELHLEDNDLTIIKIEMLPQSGGRGLFQTLELFVQNNSISDVLADRSAPLLGLRYMHLENNKLGFLPRMIYDCTKLKQFNIQNNQISYLNSSAFHNFEVVRTIDLTNNSIRAVPLLELHENKPVRNLYLGNNFVETVESKAFEQFVNLKVLDLNSNRIEKLEGSEFSGLGQLEMLNLWNNRISIIHQATLSSLTNLSSLNFADNRISFLDKQVFKDLLSLNQLNLSRNHLDVLNTINFYQLHNLRLLNLNNCYIKLISGQFQGLDNLQQLFLNDNLLSTLHSKLFEGLLRLEKLYLHNNHLTRVEMIGFFSLERLEVITLNNNKLNALSPWELPQNLMFINLTNNSLTCDCGFMVNFRSWLDEIRDTKLNIVSSSLTCFTDSQEEISVLKFDLTLCQVSYELILGLCAGILFVLFITISALYYWRTEVQVWAYSRYGIRLFYNAEEDETKPFDVFISFSNDDAQFVVQELMVGLKDYKVCVHYKHFPPGAYIADAIVDAVAQSRRTLLVFSENFLKSPYCKFEFRAAHQKSLEDRCCRLILMLKEDVEQRTMDPEMKAYFRTNTYLRWDDPAFWKKVHFALPNIQKPREELRIPALFDDTTV